MECLIKMENWIIALGTCLLVIFVFPLFFIYALCRAAGTADERIEYMQWKEGINNGNTITSGTDRQDC